MKKLLGLLVLASVATFANNIDFRVNAGVANHSSSDLSLNITTPNVQIEGVKAVIDFEGLEVKAGLGVNGAYRNFAPKSIKVGDTVNSTTITEKNKSAYEENLKNLGQRLSGTVVVPYAIAEVNAKIQNFDIFVGANLGYGLHFNKLEEEFPKELEKGKKALEAAKTEQEKATVKKSLEVGEKIYTSINPKFIYKGYVGGAYNNFRAELGYGNLSGLSISAGYGLSF